VGRTQTAAEDGDDTSTTLVRLRKENLGHYNSDIDDIPLPGFIILEETTAAGQPWAGNK
jgi:hypothetical protein